MQKRKLRSDRIIFDKKEIKLIEKLTGLGFNRKQICDLLGVSEDTLRRRIKEGNDELSAVLSRGKTKAISKIAEKAYELALMGNVSMIKYYLSTQAGWSEKQQIIEEEPEGIDEKPVTMGDLISEMNKDELIEFKILNDKWGELYESVISRRGKV